MLKYFWPENRLRPNACCKGPNESEKAFQRRFRMSRLVLQRFFARVVAHCEFLHKALRKNAVSRLGIKHLLNVICAVRQLSYGLPADLSDDLFFVYEITAFFVSITFAKLLERVLVRRTFANENRKI